MSFLVLQHAGKTKIIIIRNPTLPRGFTMKMKSEEYLETIPIESRPYRVGEKVRNDIRGTGCTTHNIFPE
jgi:hypothetical protein